MLTTRAEDSVMGAKIERKIPITMLGDGIGDEQGALPIGGW